MTFHVFGAKNGPQSIIKCDLYDPNNQIIKSISKPLAGSMNEKLYQNGIYTMCFTNTDGNEKKLNFDLVAAEEEGNEEILEISDLKRFEHELQSLHESMERVSHMINANTQRTNEQVNIRRDGKAGFQW